MIDLIGKTPLVFFSDYKGCKLFAKLEYYNPTGSIKDRTAYYIINGAIESGELNKGGTIVEATSGNNGISLAFVGKQMGYDVLIYMPENMSTERQALIKAFGARIELTPAKKGMQGAVDAALEYVEKNRGSIFANQFNNPNNIKAHYETTAPEIFNKISDIDLVIAGFGTGGTITGIANYVKNNKISCDVVGVEPFESPLINKGHASSHGIQGIGANFIPSILDVDILKSVSMVKTEDAYNSARELVLKYGILSGISGGAAYKAMLDIIDKNEGKYQKAVCIIPDSSLRYLSCGIYE